MMKSHAVRLCATASSLLLAAGAAMAGPFTAGNLVVSQVGDGTTAPTVGGSPIFLLEINPSTGAIVQTIALPTVTSGSTHAILVRGTSTSSGHLTRSVDGQYLTVAGIDGPLGGTVSISATTSATNPRIIARIDNQGNIDTTTALTDPYSGDDIRTAVTTNGTDMWLSGTNGSGQGLTGGIRYTTFGGTSAAQLASTPTNTRIVNIFNNQLYFASASGTFQGISTIGTGLPTSSGQTATLLSGFPTATGPSPYQFFFADANTLYVADDRSVANTGGVQKWTYDAGTTTWTLAYTLNTGLSSGCRGLTGRVQGGVATLFATEGTSGSNNLANHLVTVVDTGASSAFSVVGTAAPAQATFRGVMFAPVASGPAPCYANCDGSTIAPILNVNDFICFQTKYAQGDSNANCDGSTIAPVLNVNDFICFQTRYAQGCP